MIHHRSYLHRHHNHYYHYIFGAALTIAWDALTHTPIHSHVRTYIHHTCIYIRSYVPSVVDFCCRQMLQIKRPLYTQAVLTRAHAWLRDLNVSVEVLRIKGDEDAEDLASDHPLRSHWLGMLALWYTHSCPCLLTYSSHTSTTTPFEMAEILPALEKGPMRTIESCKMLYMQR